MLWTTLCFLGRKWNSTTSPTAAAVEFGVNTKPPLPTSTLMVEAQARETMVAEKSKLMFECILREIERN